MKLYVTILTHNTRPLLLRRAVQSLADQTMKNFTVLVGNTGGSPIDDAETAETLAALHAVTIQLGAVNIVEARKALCDVMASDDVFMILDDDDYLHPSCVEKLFIQIQAGADLAYGDCMHDDNSGVLKRRGSCRVPFSKEQMLTVCCIFHPMMMTKAVVTEAGGFNSEFEFASSYDLCTRISEVPDVVVVHEKTAIYYYNCDPTNVSTRSAETKSAFVELVRTRARSRRGL